MIKNAKDTLLNAESGTLPNLSGALDGWFQNISIRAITKVVENFKVTENETVIDFKGVVQPLSPQQIEMKPEGQRKWRWLQVHSATSLNLDIDDVIFYDAVKFRIKSKGNYLHYGYYRYELVEDYTND